MKNFEIVKCPDCKQLYRKRIGAFDSIFDSETYSDGFYNGIPYLSKIIKCVNNDCGKIFNTEKAEKVDEINNSETKHPQSKDAVDLVGYVAGINELEEALTLDFINDKENELIVRAQLHKRYNDILRYFQKYRLSAGEKDAIKKNIEGLIELTKETTSTKAKIYLAELYREIEDFDKCIETLSEIKEETNDENRLKEKIYSQAKLRNEKVFDIDSFAIRKEYKCSYCNDSLILFDLEKLKSRYNYKNFFCTVSEEFFSAPSKIEIPQDVYLRTAVEKNLKKVGINSSVFDIDDIICPCCGCAGTEEFNPEIHKCSKCKKGNYIAINWFN